MLAVCSEESWCFALVPQKDTCSGERDKLCFQRDWETGKKYNSVRATKNVNKCDNREDTK